MIDVLPEDQKILDQFRKGVVDCIPKDEQNSLWQRIDRSIDNTSGNIFSFSWFLPGVAAACVLLVAITYWWYAYNYPPTTSTILAIETKIQQKEKIILPDSSVVWLNAGSRLEYPEFFENDKRIVFLDGEAFFDVLPDKSRPFVVRSSSLEIKVLGTSFNITAYSNDRETVATLVKGEIELHIADERSHQTTILKPNQQAIYKKNTKSLTFSTVDPELFTSWTKGYYKFENTSFEQIAKQFERLYGVTIIFADESLKSLTYTGTFLQEQSLETVLNLLCGIKDFHYTIKSTQVYISR